MAAATPEMPDLASVHIRILESLTDALSKAISSEYESLAQKRGSLESSPKVEVVAQAKTDAKPPEVELRETSPQEAGPVFHQLFDGLPVVQPLHEELEEEDEEEEFIQRLGFQPADNFKFDSFPTPIRTETHPIVEIPSKVFPRNTAIKSKRKMSINSSPQQSPRKETRISRPQKQHVTSTSTVFQRNANGQIMKRNASGQFVASENKYEKSYETTEGSDSQEDYIPAVAKKRKISPASKSNGKKPSKIETARSSDVPLSSKHEKSSTDDSKYPNSEISPLTRPTKVNPKTNGGNLINEVSVTMDQMPVLQRIEKMVEEERYPDNNTHVLRENFKTPNSDPNTPLISKIESIENIVRNDADKEQVHDATRSKDIEESRDFHAATDEEIAAARIHGRTLVQNAWREEAPKKERIWGRVWAKYGDEKKDDSSAPGPYEWKERKHIRQFLRRRFATIPVEVVKKTDITLAKLLSMNPKEEIEPPIPKRTITSSIHFKDSDGESLLVKINTGIEELFDGKTCGDMPTHILQAMERLHRRGVTAPGPANIDKRYPRSNFKVAREYWNKKGKDAGVFYFACWNVTGHREDKWLRCADPYNHYLSKDIFGRKAWQFGARLRFLQDMAPVQQAMSLWLETVAPVEYKAYRQHVETLVKADTGLSAVKFTSNLSFLGLGSVRNVQVQNHRDGGGVRDGWVGMTCVGEFKGGELCLPDLDVKLRFLPGDVVLFRSCVLQHFIRTTIGERSSLVFFSDSSAATTVQNARYMEEGSEELEKARQEKEGILVRKRARLEKYKAYSHLEQYPTKREDLTEEQMDRGRRRKKRFLLFAKKESKKGGVATEEVAKIDSMPDWSFYELNLRELARWEKGLYPFAPTASKRKRVEGQNGSNVHSNENLVGGRNDTTFQVGGEDSASASPGYVPAEDSSESEDFDEPLGSEETSDSDSEDNV